MAPPASSPKPLISAQAVNPMGSAREHTRDFAYVEGYSNVRQDIDDDLRRHRTPERGLNFRLHWVRNQKANGNPDGTKVSQFKVMGYKFVTFDGAKSLGIEVPEHASKTPEGNIQNGDCVLMYCDAATAHKIEQDGRSAIDDRTTDEATSSSLRNAGHDLRSLGNNLVTSNTEQRTDRSESPQRG